MADFYQCLNTNCTNMNLGHRCANRKVVYVMSLCIRRTYELVSKALT